MRPSISLSCLWVLTHMLTSLDAKYVLLLKINLMHSIYPPICATSLDIKILNSTDISLQNIHHFSVIIWYNYSCIMVEITWLHTDILFYGYFQKKVWDSERETDRQEFKQYSFIITMVRCHVCTMLSIEMTLKQTLRTLYHT